MEMDKLMCLKDDLKSLYGVDIESAEVKYSTRNIVFILSDMVIRINCHPDARSMEEWMDELKLLQALKQHCLAVCAPILSSNGKLMEVLEADGKNCIAVCFEKAVGTVIQGQDIDVAHAEKMGEIAGMLHKAGTLAEASGLRIHRADYMDGEGSMLMNELSAEERELLGEKVCEKLIKIRNELLLLEKLPGKNYGLIHGDLTQYNYYVDEGKISLFDFDDCARGFYAYDIGTLMQNWILATNIMNDGNAADTYKALISAFKSGYMHMNEVDSSVWETVDFFMYVRLAITLIDMVKDVIDPARKVAGAQEMSNQISYMAEMFMAEDMFELLNQRAEQERSRRVKIAAILKNGPDENDPESMELYKMLQSPDMKPFVETFLNSIKENNL